MKGRERRSYAAFLFPPREVNAAPGSAAGMTEIVSAAIIAYLLGSIPFGLLLTRLGGIGDIRRVGSGNIGATNVLRTGNKVLAGVTLVFDVGKGVAAVLIGALWGTEAALVASV